MASSLVLELPPDLAKLADLEQQQSNGHAVFRMGYSMSRKVKLEKMKKIILHPLLVLLLMLAVMVPARAWERIETRDGKVFRGAIPNLELVLIDDQAGEAILPRASLKRVEVGPNGQVTATLKDGTVVKGEGSASVTMDLGLMKRRFPLSGLKELDFDRFVPTTHSESVKACPLRVEVPIPELADKQKKWRTTGTSKVQCDGNFLTGLTFRWRKTGSVRIGDRDGTASELQVTPLMIVGREGYQNLTLDLRLVQDGEVLGKARDSTLIGPQQGAELDEILIRYYHEDLEAGSSAPKLQIQALLTEGEKPPEPQTATWWFWVAF